jgi:hypothetical protein
MEQIKKLDSHFSEDTEYFVLRNDYLKKDRALLDYWDVFLGTVENLELVSTEMPKNVEDRLDFLRFECDRALNKLIDYCKKSKYK